MFQSFTGSSRRPRQVNLSGRANNPFAPFAAPPHASNPQSAVAIAQQERKQRQQERDRQNAALIIQRVWRGHRSRKATWETWRSEWDANEQFMMNNEGFVMETVEVITVRNVASAPSTTVAFRRSAPYSSAGQCLAQLRLLMQFVSSHKPDDQVRLAYFTNAFENTFCTLPTIATEGEWTNLLKRLATAILTLVGTHTNFRFIETYLRGAILLAGLIPKEMAADGDTYYKAISILTTNNSSAHGGFNIEPELIKEGVLALLRPITSNTISAYESFALLYLTTPHLESYLLKLNDLATQINYRMLSLAVSNLLDSPSGRSRVLEEMEARTWLLSYLIFFHRYALGSQANTRTLELEFIAVISHLLASTAPHLIQNLEIEDLTNEDYRRVPGPLPKFVKDQVSSLINQNSVTALISPKRTAQPPADESKAAHVLATYALTLLRIFPGRGDDIRMWLYLGSAPAGKHTFSGQPEANIPAVKYFWQASRSSRIFQIISSDSTKVLPLLQAKEPVDVSQEQRNQEWTTILLFLELFTFVLKVMDDDEFFSSTSSFTSSGSGKVSWTRESALPLTDIKDLTIFLKNLAFTLYWNVADLSEPEVRPVAKDLSHYFSGTSDASALSAAKDLVTKGRTNNLSGVTGISPEYFTGLVTGLLRMLHERDSRLKFLPPDHWLMTNRFDMEGFIAIVVAEDERRHEFQEQDDDEDDDLMGDEMSRENEPSGLAGASYTQQHIRRESLKRHQQRLARRRILAAIAPRLEILRNMPFFIPFETRVQIFRQFIYHDQFRRRNGLVDADDWRVSIAQATINPLSHRGDNLARHRAEIRREHVFEDALSQFYPLGEGLKEPIQISFIDQFGSMEAGIDGGGVTKEFLTSIIAEAFKTEESAMFVENDQHLLYPNPIAVEQCNAQLRALGFDQSNPEWGTRIRELLRRYEFIGRIIGKCLYEGILVDVNFASFFLLKWALTGGNRSASRESSYRASLNDLKELDASLYQGLLQLKNYDGDVEDFSLDFTVTDNITIPGERTRTMTKDLRHSGSKIPVTNSNRLVYISAIARYRLQYQPALQTDAFLQGLGQIIQPGWLSMFNQTELQTLVSGETGDIDVEDLRKNTQYGGIYVIGDDNEEHPTIKLFWQVMHSLSNEDRQKVLRFVTSTPRAPLLGFSHLNPSFSIRDSSNDEERLPSTSTCVNLLKLPRYSTAEILRTKLLYAVSSGAGFDLS
ncbi:hypothetical protein N7495_005481 [Penicillium taxi]|uniref:uncharacterized protein n=1 Tax=Penicillium taxi TaxID=168475 RepID=UPI0025456D89|nr:uncharacterized protein N7495_005481 [Penicillium taxi]KAJ5893790.1 hypothetical protein N7495_005481 [Penicillium taxi]